ncbi:trigger factor [Devriesea agamarum]|uniref:trigger factor n=1 Tax=Devriesea agamarum TaxID=472569 RepID=UPI00071E5A93|nr:trigger factor [Devriesea agamarum]
MKTAADQLNPTRVKLTVEVPFDELKPSVDKAVKDISEKVQIPGFRKGKVPVRILEQRVGRAAIMQEAINEALPGFYQQAVAESDIRPAGRPEVEVQEIPGLDGKEDGNFVFTAELDVRPEITLPEFAGYEIEIEEPAVDDDAVQARLTQLQERFGTLVGVDRPAEDGDFVSLDMTAKIGDEEIESVEGVSYRVGEGNMLEGLDEALIGLSAGESTTFTSKLVGGDHAGEEADVTVTAQSVKVRELPEVNDEFAEMASEFDTVDELMADLRTQVEKSVAGSRVARARTALLDKLIADLEIPVPQGIVDEEVKNHLQNEGKSEDDSHAEEIRSQTEEALRAQFILDVIAEENEVNVSQEDLMSHLMQMSAQYGMDPNTFIQAVAQSGQIEMMVREVAQSKALDVALGKVTVKNADGEVLDLDLPKAEDAKSDSAESENAESEDLESSDQSEDAEAAEEKPVEKKPAAKKAPAKKASAKKAKASDEDASEEAAGEKKPAAKKAPAKKAPAKKPAAKKAASKDETEK